jgi:hypothetical protein
MDGPTLIRTGVAELCLDSLGFLRITLVDTDVPFDIHEAKKQFETAFQLTKGKPYKVLVDTRQTFVTPTKEAEQYISKVQLRQAEALIIDSLHYRILAKFYVRQIKHIPIKIFKTEDEAIAWLISLP